MDPRKTVVIAGDYKTVKEYCIPRKIYRDTLIIAEKPEDILYLHRKDVREEILLLGGYLKNPVYKSEALKLLRYRLQHEPAPNFAPQEVSHVEGQPG